MTHLNTNPRSGIHTSISLRQEWAPDLGSGSHGQLFLPYTALFTCSLPFTTKTGAKHPFSKAPAPHDTCGSCWLCGRHLTDCDPAPLYFLTSPLLCKSSCSYASRVAFTCQKQRGYLPPCLHSWPGN